MASNESEQAGTAPPPPAAPPPVPVPIPDLLSDPTPVPATVSAAQPFGPGSATGVPVEPPPDAAKTGYRASIIAAARKAPQKALALTRKHVTYGQLARKLKELAQAPENKSANQQLVSMIFPKLAVYNSVDPSLGPALLHMLQSGSNASVLRYSYYFLSRILSESGEPQNAPGGSVPTPNWDSLAEVATPGAPSTARADVVLQILSRLVTEASTTDITAHPRRVAALKALVCMPMDSTDAFDALVKITVTILDKCLADRKQRRRRTSLFSRGNQDKEAAIRGNLLSAALSALRRLPLDPTNDSLIERVVIGVGCPDPVGVRHALAMAAEMALTNPVGVADSLARLAGGSIAEALKSSDVFARAYLARLCGILIHSSQLYERPDMRGLFSAILFQLLYDPSNKVLLEVANHIAGSINGEGSGSQRADGWQILTTSFTEGRPATNDEKKAAKGQEPPRGKPELVLKVVVDRLDLALRSSSRPLLHGALRTVAELGKARSAAHSYGMVGEDEVETPEDDVLDFAAAMGRVAPRESNTVSIEALLGTLMEGVRVVTACECVYVRAEALKAMIWMQSEVESSEELKSTLEAELRDPSWPPSALNDLFQTLHLRFKVAPGMAVMLLDLANVFVAHVPSKVDTASIQSLWKMCLVGCGAEGKHLALEAVSGVLDRPPPPPPPRNGETLTLDQTTTSDPRSAIALQRLLQCAIWFLGENANYAAAEYAWEGATPPAAALMMLDTERMVAASGIRNPTLAASIARLQRCIAAGSWEERVVAARALITIAIRSGEPYRLQIYEFFHALIYGGGGAKDKFRGMATGLSNGEDVGATGTGLQSVISPMLRVLDEMYQAQDLMMKEIRQHDFNKEEWKEEELKAIYGMHSRLMDLTLLFCFVPRSKYLPLGPVSAPLVKRYRDMKGINPNENPNDEAIVESMNKLLTHGGAPKVTPDFPPVTLLEPISDDVSGLDGGMRVGGEAGDVVDEEAAAPYAMAMNFDEIWARSLVEADDNETEGSDDDDGSPRGSSSGRFGVLRNWDEESISGMSGGPGALSRADSSLSRNESSSRRDSDFDGYKPEAASYLERYDEDELRQNMEGTERRVGKALYAFVGQDEDELSLEAGEEVEIEYEVDGWVHIRKKEPGPDGKVAGLVPAMYVK